MGRTELGFYHGGSPPPPPSWPMVNFTPPLGCTPPGLATQTGAPKACMATITTVWLGIDLESVKLSPTMVMAILWLLTIPPTMLLDMEFIITDTARGLQHNKRPKPTKRPKRPKRPKNSYRPRYYYYRR